MANELTDAAELLLLDLIDGVTTAAPVTGPLKLALLTVQGTDSAAGTEVTGGSYARQTITFGSAAAGAAANTNSITFSGMPAASVVGFAIYDSSGTPKRLWEIPRTGGATSTASGDSVNVAIGAITVGLN